MEERAGKRCRFEGEEDAGTGLEREKENEGLCRRLKRKNLQDQRREGGGGSP